MQTDPYSTPTSNVHPSTYGNSHQVTQAVLHQLAGTKPWVRFMSVLMFIGAGFLLLAALGLLLAGGVIASNGGNAMFAGGMGVAISVFYAVLSIVYIYPALKLWKYASSIGILMMTGNELDLIAALNHQRSFWKFVGILVLAMLVLYFVALIGVIALGGFAAMSARP